MLYTRITQDEQTFNTYKELLKGNAAIIYLDEVGRVTSFDGIKEFSSLAGAEELNNYDVMGAVLSYNSEKEKFIVWNGNKNTNTWDWDAVAVDSSKTVTISGVIYATAFEQTVPTTYGTPIAVCVGNGIWVVINNGNNNATAELYNNYMWANTITTMSTSYITEGFKKHGAEICREIYKRANLSGSELFTFAKSIRPMGVTDCRCYVPSMQQQMNIMTDVHKEENYGHKTTVLCNVIKYSNDMYWTASQSADVTSAYYSSQYSNVSATNKVSIGKCFFCIHFGQALA